MFPQPQYLGSKYHLLDWITKYIPNDVKTTLDAFGGSQSVAYRFKELGYRTFTNDFLYSQVCIGDALISNSSDILTEEDINHLFEGNKNEKRYNLVDKNFKGLFFNEEDSKILDSFRSNVDYYFKRNLNKKALALTVMDRAMTRKVTMGHFAHTKALEYASNPDRVKRNKSLIVPIKELFLELVEEYNDAVFDNGENNLSYWGNILEILPSVIKKNVDLVYFDPPYCGSHPDYQSFYHVLESYCCNWEEGMIDYVNSIHRYEPKRYSGFDKKKEVINNFNKLFELSKDIPYWLISYNDGSYPDEDTFIEMIKQYKNVEVEKYEYKNSRGGKGSVKGRNELLFVCKPIN